jgi:hypothetical protein
VNLTHKVNIRGFGDMVRHIRANSDKTLEQILAQEAKGLLTTMVRRSPAASRKSIEFRENQRKFVTYRGKKYRIRGVGRYGNQKHEHANRYPDMIWAGLMSLRRQSVARKMIARGLLKQSWLQIGDDLGLPVTAPAFVRKARAATAGFSGKRGRGDSNVLLRRIKTGLGQRAGFKWFRKIILTNFSQVARVTGGRRLLNQVIASRVRQFRRGIQEEFKKLARAGAAKNPGATIT